MAVRLLPVTHVGGDVAAGAQAPHLSHGIHETIVGELPVGRRVGVVLRAHLSMRVAAVAQDARADLDESGRDPAATHLG